jgi:hypothetical protein
MADKSAIAKAGMNISKLLLLSCILLVAVRFSWESVIPDYRWYVCGAIIFLFLYLVFQEWRKYASYRAIKKYDYNLLTTKNEKLFKIMDILSFEITRFQNSVSYYFFSVRSYKYTTAILAGLSTVVLGLDFSGVQLPYDINITRLTKNIALVIGAAITILTTMAVYWNIEKYWLHNKIMLQRLRDLRDRIEMADKKGPLDADQIDQFGEELKKIRGTLNEYWEEVLAERNNPQR